MPQDKAALPYVLAKKCRLSYEQFMETKEAVYAFNFMHGEKVLESQCCSDLKALGEGWMLVLENIGYSFVSH